MKEEVTAYRFFGGGTLMNDARADRRTELFCLVVVLVVAAALRLWRLDDNGFGTLYYAAGVRSLLQGGWLLFYNSFDPAGVVSLDKPPITFWIQAAFASFLGFSGWVLHLPQALAGIGSVAILYHLVRRPFGPVAGLIAAFLLAITPIAVAIDRSNNTDSWLVLFLLLAAWAALRGRGPSLLLSMALLGVAFNVKMLAALVCGPAILAAWLSSGALNWRKRFAWVTAGGATLAVVGLSWAIAFDLTPAASRPYAGSTRGNSMLELVMVHNGLERFVRTRPPRPTPPAQAADGRRFQTYDRVPTGPLRLAAPTLVSQFAWCLPLAVVGFVLAMGWRRRSDGTQSSLALWGIWALTYGIVFSVAGGIFYAYYLSALAPPLAALGGIGCVQLWRRGPTYLALGLALCAAWQIYITGPSIGWASPWLSFAVVGLVCAAATLRIGKQLPAAIGGIALIVLPIAWALSPVFATGNRVLPYASFARWLGLDDGRGVILSHNFPALGNDPKLFTFLAEHRSGAHFALVAPTTGLVAPLIIHTGQPALAYGGFFGSDPILSLDAFAAMAKRGEVRFVLLGDRMPESETHRGQFIRWVREHATPVDPALWRSVPPEMRRSVMLYDLKGS